jgi:hypothetical protein
MSINSIATDAKPFAYAVSAHWEIEKNVMMRKDDCHI